MTVSARNGGIRWAEPHLLCTVGAPDAQCVGLLPDAGHAIVHASSGLFLFDLDGDELWRRTDLPPGTGATIEWLPGGEWALVRVGDELRLLDVHLGEWGPTPPGLSQVHDVRSVAPSADGRQVAVATGRSGQGAVLVVRMNDGSVTRQRGIVDPVVALVWSSPGTLVSATSTAVQSLSTETSVVAGTLAADCDDVRALLMTVDRGGIVIAERDRIRFLRMGNPDRAVVVSVDDPRALAQSRHGTHVFVGTPTGIQVLAADGHPDGSFPGQVLAPGHLRVSAGGHVIARLDEDRVAVYESPDAAPRLPGRRPAAARRWASAMAVTLGRRADTGTFLDHPAVTSSRVIGEASSEPATVACSADAAWYVAHAGSVTRTVSGAAQPTWRSELGPGLSPYDLVIAADDRLLAAASRKDLGRVVVIEAGTGRVRQSLPGGQSPVFDPTDPRRLAVPEPGRRPSRLLIYRLGDEPVQIERLVDGGIGRLDWSPDGRLLAAAADGRIIIWDTTTWHRQPGPQLPGVVFSRVSWSPDQRMLAAAGTSSRAPLLVFETETWSLLAEVGTCGGRAWAPCLDWSPDSRYLLAPMPGPLPTAVHMWQMDSRSPVCTVHPPPGGTTEVWSVRWATGGHKVAIGHMDGRIVEHDLSNAPAGPAGLRPLPYPVEVLARLGATAADVGATVALDVLAGLLQLTGGDVPPGWAGLAELRPVRDLCELRWPVAARVGIVAMVALDLRLGDRFRAPAGHTRDELTTALRLALNAAPVPPQTSGVPLAELTSALAQVDDDALALLQLLGPDAVQADPGLPAGLRGLRGTFSPMTPQVLKLIGTRLSFTEDGSAEGRGSGDSRAGLSRQGELNRLLPTQIALPEGVFETRRARDELLFRTRRGRLPPHPVGLILLMDDTPGAFGQVGLIIRTCTHLLARTMLERSRPCYLVRLGAGESERLERPRDLIQLWTRHSLEPVPAIEAAARVRLVATQLADRSGRMPRVVALTHVHRALPPVSGMREVRVAFPGSRRAGQSTALPSSPSLAELHNVLRRILTEPGEW